MFTRIISGSLIVVVLASAVVVAQDALAKLGLSQSSARESVMTGVTGGWVNYGAAASAFKKADAAARAQLVSGAIAWAKAYAASPEFKAAYAKVREERKPRAPEFKDTPEDVLAKQQAEQDKNVAEMKKALEGMAPDVRKQVEEGMKQAAEAMKQMDTPEMRKMQLDGIRMQREGDMQSYKDALAKWQQEYPDTPGPMIAKRLKTFLDTSATVDFDAKLQPKGDKMVFVNPQYEGKSSEWKVCYRAGREAVQAARTAAEAWLAELK
jgi:hypothetical protein